MSGGTLTEGIDSDHWTTALFAEYPDGLLLIDQGSLKIVAANRVACQLLGYQATELLQLEVTAIESSIENIFYWDEVRAGDYRGVDLSDGYYQRRDGSTRPIKKRISCLTCNGRPMLLIDFRDSEPQLAMHDALLHSTSLLTATLEATADGILTTTLDGAISNMNQRMAEMWQMPEALIHAGDDVRIQAFMRESVADTPIYDSKLAEATANTDGDSTDLVVLSNGQVFERHTRPLHVQGCFSGHVFSFRDITGQHRYEQQLQAKNDELEKASAVKSQFLANMSHEIRTPMNAIIGLSRLCLATDLSAKQRDYVEKVFNAGESLLGIINDILDFSKIEAGKLHMESVPFQLSKVLEHVENMTSAVAESKGLSLRFLPEFLPQQATIGDELCGDPLRLGQVLLNLVSNAIKFTAQGSVTVRVMAQAVTQDNVRLEFCVQDTGIGMTKEQRGRMFQSFSQADTSTTRKYGGTGLGLAISKSLIEMMGGHIGVSSAPGVGTTFTFDVLLTRSHVTTTAQDQETPMLSTEDLSGVRVLLVEDNLINQQIAYELLSEAGLHVAVANHGEECLALLAQQVFDVVLMDVQMPVMDGYEATTRIRANPSFKALPVIAMTANAMAGDDQRCIDVGMNDHVSKPVIPEQLFGVLRKWMEKDTARKAG